MQNNNNYANSLDPDLRGSVDFDFFSNEGGKDDTSPRKDISTLSTIDEGDRASQSSGENSFNTASIDELGGRSTSHHAAAAKASSSSSSSPSRSLSRTSGSSDKSASTIRSGGFPTVPRGDSARPASPTPPSSHASPSPHLLRSRPLSAVGSKPSRSASSLGGSSANSGGTKRRSVSPRASRNASSDSRSASPSESRSASPSDSRSVSPRDSRSVSSRGSRSVSPRDSRSVSPRGSQRSGRSFSSRSPSPSSSSDYSSPRRRQRSGRRSSSSRSRSSSPKDHASSVSSSESDVTDVSPLSSKNASPVGSPTTLRKLPPVTGPTRHHKDQVSYRAGKENETGEEQLNVELIMKAILELDRERHGRPTTSSPGSVSSKRSMSSERQSKKNFSFDSQRCQQIEKENRRLLDSLLGHSVRRRASTGTILTAPPRPYHSTINRIRQQRKIEEENLQILKRLERIRPTPNMSRDQQLRDYRRQTNYGIVLPGGKKTAKGRRRQADLSESEQSEPRPQSRQSSASRPSSAASKPSARPSKPKPASSRPDWPSGW